MSIFTTLNGINVNEHVEKKNGLSYLSWAWAWAELKKNYPDSYYTVYENVDGWNYFTDGRTAWVKTGVTIVDAEKVIEHIEYLPVMDYKNRSIPVDQITSFDVNKAIQRSLTKAVARHGLGLYIYAGEDLPEGEKDPPIICECCKKPITPVKGANGKTISVNTILQRGKDEFSKKYCYTCLQLEVKKKKAVDALNGYDG